LESIGFFDENLPVCEDYDLWIRILVENEIGYLKEKLVTKFGGHEDQLSSKHWGMDRFRVLSLKNLLIHSKLSTNQRISVLNTLTEKLNILAQGFAKHGKFAKSEEFLREMKTFSRELLTYSTAQPLNS
jgi:pentatricopeptide repeat protein